MTMHSLRGLAVVPVLLASLFSQPGRAPVPAFPGRYSQSIENGKDDLFPTPIQDFTNRITNGEADLVTGIYFSPDLAFPVIQQPDDDPIYVSNLPGLVTQYRLASITGTTGILAHNTLAGAEFFRIYPGQTLYLIYGNGNRKEYQVTDIRDFQALDPENPYSNFQDENNPTEALTSTTLFNTMYSSGSDQVVFQTCIDKDGNPSWGRRFITAKPVEPDFFAQVQTNAAYAQ